MSAPGSPDRAMALLTSQSAGDRDLLPPTGSKTTGILGAMAPKQKELQELQRAYRCILSL